MSRAKPKKVAIVRTEARLDGARDLMVAFMLGQRQVRVAVRETATELATSRHDDGSHVRVPRGQDLASALTALLEVYPQAADDTLIQWQSDDVFRNLRADDIEARTKVYLAKRKWVVARLTTLPTGDVAAALECEWPTEKPPSSIIKFRFAAILIPSSPSKPLQAFGFERPDRIYEARLNLAAQLEAGAPASSDLTWVRQGFASLEEAAIALDRATIGTGRLAENWTDGKLAKITGFRVTEAAETASEYVAVASVKAIVPGRRRQVDTWMALALEKREGGVLRSIIEEQEAKTFSAPSFESALVRLVHTLWGGGANAEQFYAIGAREAFKNRLKGSDGTAIHPLPPPFTPFIVGEAKTVSLSKPASVASAQDSGAATAFVAADDFAPRQNPPDGIAPSLATDGTSKSGDAGEFAATTSGQFAANSDAARQNNWNELPSQDEPKPSDEMPAVDPSHMGFASKIASDSPAKSDGRNSGGRGRPRIHASDAARKKAWRDKKRDDFPKRPTGRPRIHATDADRRAAYRAKREERRVRTVRVTLAEDDIPELLAFVQKLRDRRKK